MQESYSSYNMTQNDLERMTRAGNFKLVSDSSFLNTIQLGTAAWLIALSRHQYLIGRHFTPGTVEIQCSHRSKLSGMLGAIMHTNDLYSQFKIEEGNAELHCDRQGAVDVISYFRTSTNPSLKHFNIIHSIMKAITLSPLKWIFKHM